jgi:hypothetical protein
LNYLLEEEVPIRDMNIILKTIAANIKKNYKLYELGDMVRQQLASSFIKNYTDENNVLHVIKIGKDTCKFLSYKAFYPKSKKTMPYCVLETEDLRRFYHSVLPSLQKFSQRNLIPVLVCEAKIRPLLAEILHREMPWVRVISDVELFSIEKDISIKPMWDKYECPEDCAINDDGKTCSKVTTTDKVSKQGCPSGAFEYYGKCITMQGAVSANIRQCDGDMSGREVYYNNYCAKVVSKVTITACPTGYTEKDGTCTKTEVVNCTKVEQ